MTRLYSGGLDSVSLVVGDGAGAIESARSMVYPKASFQLCLWHSWPGLCSLPTSQSPVRGGGF